MSKKLLLAVGIGAALFLGKAQLPATAMEVSSSEPEITSSSSEITTSSEEIISSSEEIVSSSSEELSSSQGVIDEIIDEQLAQIENIIVALFASFAGTGTVALIVKLALSKLTKAMTNKVTEAENQNKISTAQAQAAIQSIVAFEQVLKGQVDALENTVKALIQNQNITNEQIKLMLEEYKQRDEQIKDLIIKEFEDEIK